MISIRDDREKGMFDSDMAVEHGLEAAAVIEKFRVWVRFNLNQNRNIKYGRCWTYNTLEGLVREFPWLKNKDKASRLMSKLTESGVLVKGQHATNRNDRTQWYAFSDEYAKLLNVGITQLCDVSSQKCDSDVAEVRQGLRKSATCNDKEATDFNQKKKRAEVKTVAPTAVPAVEPEPRELTIDQADWEQQAMRYVDPLPDPNAITPADLEARDLPVGIAVKPLRMMLLQCGLMQVPVSL